MLEFKKTYKFGEIERTSSFSVTSDGSLMVVTRMVDNKGLRLLFRLDGTIGMLGIRVNDICKMPDGDFKLYSEIQFAKEIAIDNVSEEIANAN